jgi:hypothetical protein
MSLPLFKFRNPLIVSGSTGVTVSDTGLLDGVSKKNVSISIGQEVETTSDVVFNNIDQPSEIVIGTSSQNIVLSYQSISGSITHRGDDFIVSGSLTTPNLIFNGSVTADKIEASLTGSNTVYNSGSTEFGNTMSSSGFNDRHDITGSISISGSYTLNNSNTMVEISNDTADDGGSQTALATEKVAYNSFGDQQPGFEFVRRKFAHTGSFVSSTTASFTAVTASTVTGLDAVTKHDFMFFNKGMLMEYDAIDVEQSGSTFLMKVNASSMGYGLDNNDEIVAWGKWNA